MADTALWITWDTEQGIVDSSFGRLMLVADGFIKGFYDELRKSGGVALGKIMLNDLGRDLGIEIPRDRNFLWEDFEALIDGRFTSFGSVRGMPPSYTWDGTGRLLQYMGSFTVKLWPVKLIGALKASAARNLTERGAQAIIGQASRRAGRLIGEIVGAGYGWDTLKIIYDTIGDVMARTFTELGWGKLRIVADYANLVVVFIFENAYELAAEGKDAHLTIVRNQIEGVGEYMSEREGMKSRTREFSLPDDNGIRVIVVSMAQPGKELDWDAIKWEKMVA